LPKSSKAGTAGAKSSGRPSGNSGTPTPAPGQAAPAVAAFPVIVPIIEPLLITEPELLRPVPVAGSIVIWPEHSFVAVEPPSS